LILGIVEGRSHGLAVRELEDDDPVKVSVPAHDAHLATANEIPAAVAFDDRRERCLVLGEQFRIVYLEVGDHIHTHVKDLSDETS